MIEQQVLQVSLTFIAKLKAGKVKYFIPLLLMLWLTGCTNGQVSPSSELPTADEQYNTSTDFRQFESISPEDDLENESGDTEKSADISSEEAASEVFPQAAKLNAEEQYAQINLASQP